jgi:polysaccharide biosynthesis protein PslH
MKILYLTSRIPYPPHQGDKLRNWHFLQYLSKNHEVHLISFFSHDVERQYESNLNRVCTSVTLVKLSLLRSLLNCFIAVFRRIPFQVAYYESKNMRSHVLSAIKRIQPDIIHTHLMRMAPYSVEYKNIARVLDLTDAVSLYLSRYKKICRNPIFRRLIQLELKRVLTYEGIIEEYDSTLICSTIDCDVLRGRYKKARLDLINNSVAVNVSTQDGQVKRDPFRITFVGNMSYPPNADAVKYFVRNIFPSIKREIPEAKFYIVGNNPNRNTYALRSKDIIVTGFVDNIQKEYLASSVVVSPIRFGAGALTKVLESLMLGIPVVSTSVGVEGLQLVHGKEIFITDDPLLFSKYVIDLIHNPVLWKNMARSAFEVARSRFDSQVIGAQLINVYKDITCKPSELQTI